MSKKEKVKAFIEKHKKGFIAGGIGLVTTIVGAIAYNKGKKDYERDRCYVKTSSAFWDIVTDGAKLKSAINESYEKNEEIEYVCDFEDDDHLMYESRIKVLTECIGD